MSFSVSFIQYFLLNRSENHDLHEEEILYVATFIKCDQDRRKFFMRFICSEIFMGNFKVKGYHEIAVLCCTTLSC